MEAYTLDQFDRYYRNSWVIDPSSGKPYCVYGCEAPDIVLLHNKKLTEHTKRVPQKHFEWKHVTTPKLGYRNIDISGHDSLDGKNLSFISKVVANVRERGIHPSAIKVKLVDEVLVAMQALELDTTGYKEQPYQIAGGINGTVADQIFNPKFVKFPDALDLIVTKADATGYAISHDVALVLGNRKDSALKLVWNRATAAQSSDGVRWHLVDSVLKDNLERVVGKLRYTNA